MKHSLKIKYSLKKQLLNEAKKPGVVDDESKGKATRNLQKCLGWLLKELVGEWQVSEPIIDDSSQESYLVKVELTNGSAKAKLRMGWKAYLNGDWSARKQIWESDVYPYAWVTIGAASASEQGFATDSLSGTTRVAIKKCLKQATMTNPELLKNMTKSIATSEQIAKIKESIKDWCRDTVTGTNYRWIRLEPSGLQGSVRTDIDQIDFYDEDGEELGGKLDDQEYSFKVSLQRTLENRDMLHLIKEIKIEYAPNEKGWLWFSVELNS